jgi:hypothetical protein
VSSAVRRRPGGPTAIDAPQVAIHPRRRPVAEVQRPVLIGNALCFEIEVRPLRTAEAILARLDERQNNDSLNKLRDAHIQFTLSHQSLADLELVSKEFAQAVWDNARTKDILAQDNPELCERMARSLGTMPRLEHTVQQASGALATVAPTGVFSSRAVEAYRLHPNRLKSLASRGQGYLFASRPSGRIALPIVYGRMPELPAPSKTALRRNDQTRAPGLRLYQRFVAAHGNDGVSPLQSTSVPASGRGRR